MRSVGTSKGLVRRREGGKAMPRLPRAAKGYEGCGAGPLLQEAAGS